MPQKRNIKRTCKECNKTFLARKHTIENGKAIYCSWNCSGKSKRKRVERMCKKCGSVFEVKIGVIKNGHGKFCSKECFLSSYRKEPKRCVDCGISIDHRAIRCVVCHFKNFIPPMRGKKQSMEVRKKLSISKQNKRLPKTSGKNHWNWQGGICNLKKRIRNQVPYRIWRTTVFKRDDFTCQKCGVMNKKGLGKTIYLEAHHKKSIKQIFKDNRVSAIDDVFKIKEFWDVDNGITLCRNCHKKIHGWRTLGKSKGGAWET